MFSHNFSVYCVSAPEILSQPFWYRFIYYNLCCFSHRIFYYIAWTLSDLVNNASGFGFNGYDEKGKPKWDLLTNVNIIQLEVISKSFYYVSRKNNVEINLILLDEYKLEAISWQLAYNHTNLVQKNRFWTFTEWKNTRCFCNEVNQIDLSRKGFSISFKNFK